MKAPRCAHLELKVSILPGAPAAAGRAGEVGRRKTREARGQLSDTGGGGRRLRIPAQEPDADERDLNLHGVLMEMAPAGLIVAPCGFPWLAVLPESRDGGGFAD